MLPMRTITLLGLIVTSLAFGQSPLCSVIAAKRVQCKLDSEMLRFGEEISLPLGRTVKAERRGFHREGGYDVWVGRLAGQPQSEAVLVNYEGHLVGNVRTGTGEYYTIRPTGDGTVEVREVSQAPVDSESIGYAPDLPAGTSSRAKDDLGSPRMALASTIDVLVVYSASAKAAAGGDGPIRARIGLAIAEANLAFGNSMIDIIYRLVGAQEYNPVAPYSTAEGPVPNFLLEVTADIGLQALRNSTGADLVNMWIEGSGAQGGASGAAWQMSPPNVNGGFAPRAYSVVEQNFALGPYYNFSRVLGLNLGGAPDRAAVSGPGAFPYSFGFQSQAGRFVDIAANLGGCKTCVRLNLFSNPLVSVSGFPTGIANPSPQSADLATTFNQTRLIAEAFRAPVGPAVVTPPVTGPFIKGFLANPARISQGEQTVLQWDTVNATTTSINQGVGPQPLSTKSVLVTPTATTTYTLTASDGTTTVTRQVTVIVDPVVNPAVLAPPNISFPTGSFLAFQTGVAVNVVPLNSGGVPTSCSANPPLPPGLGLSSACVITGTPTTPQPPTGYRFLAMNEFGGRQVFVNIEITGAPPPPVLTPVINSFGAAPPVINVGQTSTLSWNVTNATSLTLNGSPVSGTSTTVSPLTSTVYTLVATNSNGSISAQTTVTVNAAPLAINFTSPTPGQSISGTWFFTVFVPSGIQVATASFQIDALSFDPLYPATGNLYSSGYDTNRLTPGPHTAQARVTSTGGTVYTTSVNFIVVATPAPPPPPIILSFAANPTTILSGQSSMLSWNVTGASGLTLNGGAVSGTSLSVTPASTTLYTLVATNSVGVTATATVTVTVNAAPPPPPSGAITILYPASGISVTGVLFVGASVSGFTPADPWLLLNVGGFRTVRLNSTGGPQYEGGVNLNGLPPGTYVATVSSVSTTGTPYSTTFNVVIPEI